MAFFLKPREPAAGPVRSTAPAPLPAALHFEPPSLRELRAQSLHRAQFGLGGLAAMLLLVGLANIIMDRARQSDAGTVTTNGSRMPNAAASPNSDPMVDIGVAPDMPNSPSRARSRAAPVVAPPPG